MEIRAAADLSMTKDDGQTSAVPGQSVIYTLEVSNGGPNAVSGATVSDTFPEILACTWTCSPGTGATCTSGPITGDINDTAVDLPAGGGVTYTAICEIDSAATGALVNLATVSAPAGVVDSDNTNNSAVDNNTLTPKADLSLTKDDGDPLVGPGGSVTYTLGLTNHGPSVTTGGTVSDDLPPGLTFGSSPDGCTELGGTVTCSFGALGVNDAGSVRVIAVVGPLPPANISNTAVVTGNEMDPMAANNQATEITLVDIEPPSVAGIDTVADTGDGVLEACEQSRVPIRQILVSFSEAVFDPAGDADPHDVTNPDNYRVIAPGPDQDFDTALCGPPVGDDQAISINEIAYDSETHTATVDIGDGQALADSQYRLLVCGVTGIQD
ncbi:MAG: DUF11 domain-containing protein, partial [Actinomycetia bacterium]|nr:DUF11 domain-containing protein [Actinomycetes bacterium]